MLPVDETKLKQPLAFTAWWAMHAWLQNFEYRAPLSWWVFVIAAAAMMLIALFILSVRTARTAMENPIKSLRIE